MLDHDFRLRSGDEHAAIDMDIERPESPATEYVLQRLARDAALHHLEATSPAQLAAVRVDVHKEICSIENTRFFDDAPGFAVTPELPRSLDEELPPAPALSPRDRRDGEPVRHAPV